MKRVVRLVLALFVVVASFDAAWARGIDAAHLAVVINVNDPQSVAVGAYYQSRRHIPAANVIKVSMSRDAVSISASEFAKIRTQVERQTRADVQAYALTWLKPYRVECMSITSAFTFGFNRDFCAEGCKLTRESPYFDSISEEPVVDFGIRPTMSIAAMDVEHARALIDRGVASDGTAPKGTAYLLSTSDKSRNVRAARYPIAEGLFSYELKVKQLNMDALSGTQDVMFYFTGMQYVQQLTSNRFLPGAIADHLTSTGGDLVNTRQMSSLRWLEAGATGSYGAVIEPCNFPSKFPDPVIVMKHYLAGETLIEAYWKSVAMPGQGIFIGEPLARPYAVK